MKFFLFIAISVLISSLCFAQAPEGFTSIFNGKNLDGWHISRTTHQGTTPDVSVENGEIVLRQRPYGQGGVVLSNKKYKNFELYLEVKIDSFTNGGIFIRSSESGIAYQVELDETSRGTGTLLGERLNISTSVKASEISKVWKANNWNSFRIKMVGDTPQVTLWVNDVLMWDVKQPKK